MQARLTTENQEGGTLHMCSVRYEKPSLAQDPTVGLRPSHTRRSSNPGLNLKSVRNPKTVAKQPGPGPTKGEPR
eukprot:6456398-Amphidinium_carterae.1